MSIQAAMMLAFSGNKYQAPPGEAIFENGTTINLNFKVPLGVKNICAVLVGVGGPAGRGFGGDLRWINDLPVTPDETLTIAFSSTTVRILRESLILLSVTNGNYISPGALSTPFGDGPYGGTVGGGNGGNAGIGGAGAGGYSGNGGNGGTTGGAGAGGAGGGGSFYVGGAGGGGVGLFGQGASGAGGTYDSGTPRASSGGAGGSGGTKGDDIPITVSPFLSGNGGHYGGGAGNSHENSPSPGKSGLGACRIMWGGNRSFPFNAGPM